MTHTPGPILPIHFVEKMNHRWTSSLKNASSESLKLLWRDMAAAFGLQIMQHNNPEKNTEWQILQPPTGTGKTQGTIVYCSMLAQYPLAAHPGVLLVTRLKADADRMAEELNRLTGQQDYAFSYHSDKHSEGLRETLENYPVLIVTHSAYQRAFSLLADQAHSSQTYPLFHAWKDTGRMLVVIDEAFQIIKESQIDLDGIRITFAAIPQTLREKYPNETKAIAEVIKMMETKLTVEVCKETIIPKSVLADARGIDFSSLRAELRKVRFDLQQKRSDPDENSKLLTQHDGRVSDLQAILNGYMYYAKIPDKGHTLNTSTLIVPPGVKGAVVLDATASYNVIYELFDRATVLPIPRGARSYQNVTVYVNRGRNIGKVSMRRNPDEILKPVMDDLNERLKGKKVFFATHNDIENRVYAEKTTFDLSVGHWGNIDGSNEWMACDTAVICGLRSMPSTWTANVYSALQGARDTAWLQTKARPFRHHADVRSALKTRQTVTEVIQAINRIQCRRVVDSEGNCLETAVYILLPEGRTGDQVLKGITDMMEGVVVKPWVIQGFTAKTTKNGRPSGSGNSQQAMLTYLKNALPGKTYKSTLKSETLVTDASLKRFIADAKTDTTEVARSLKALGIIFQCDGFGCKAKSYFLKT
jgi:hypothetical protein